MGDARLATPCNVLKWAIPPAGLDLQSITGGTFNQLPEFDYSRTIIRWNNGSPICARIENWDTSTNLPGGNGFCGNQGSSCFAMAIDLETSNGGEIAGLNAEEQSDISLIARWNVPQASGMVFDIYTYIDSMIVLRENNVKNLLI